MGKDQKLIDGKTVAQWEAVFAARHKATAFDPDYTPTPATWLIEDLFQSGGKLNFVLGQEKAGKSRFIRWQVAHLLAEQEPFGLRTEAEVKKVLWCGSEEGYDAFYTNIHRYGEVIKADTRDWEQRLVHIASADMGLERRDSRLAFEFGVLKHSPQLIIMDSLRYLHGADENGGPELTAMINAFRRWTNKYKYDMITNQHSGKLRDDAVREQLSTWVRGSSSIAAVIDCAVALERFDKVDENIGQKVKLYRFGRHAPDVKPWVLYDRGRKDKNQAAATDLGWELQKKG